MLARAARPTLQLSRSIRANQVRGVHFENKVYDNFPFKYHNKTTFAIKYFTFIGVGFVAPFIVSWYHINKSS